MIDPHEFAENARALRGEKNKNEEILALRSDYEKLSYQLDSLKRINGSEKIEKDAGNSRKMKWKLLERTELLLQIISESKKPLPKLWRMKTLIEKWNVPLYTIHDDAISIVRLKQKGTLIFLGVSKYTQESLDKFAKKGIKTLALN